MKRVGILLLAFALCRLLFLFFNWSQFNDLNVMIFIGGLHFDIATIFMINLPFVILHLLPFHFRSARWYQIILKVLFFLVNIPAIGFNLADVEYFKFTMKRSTADLLDLMTLGDDVGNLLPQFLTDYWYLPLVLLLLLIGMNWLYRKTEIDPQKVKPTFRYYIQHTLIFLLATTASVYIARGGIQYKPLSIISASDYADTQNIPLVLNTPFTIVKTMGKSSLEPKSYFSESEAKKIFDPVLQIDSEVQKKPNVVVLILESFSEEFVGALNQSDQTYTPFLDSLIGKSIRFEAGYANGRKSIEALPAIIGGIPSLMVTPYIQSAYGGNTITSLPGLLGEQGYSSSFFHGGNNGTMGFDAFSEAAGFDRYVGRNEYPYEGDYDGNWGVFDEPFLQFYADELQKEQQPFFSCMFTLSSHHPFSMPEKYEERFDAPEPIHRSVQYADYSLRKFFKKVKDTEWFQNTWFVVTADHTSITHDPFYQNRVGSYRVPLFFYHPQVEPEIKKGVVQHSDILPSVLELTGFNEEIIRFGYNAFEEEERYVFAYLNNTYQIINESYLLEFNGEETTALFDIKQDPLLKTNLLEHGQSAPEMEETLKAVIQQFNNRMINNNLSVQ